MQASTGHDEYWMTTAQCDRHSLPSLLSFLKTIKLKTIVIQINNRFVKVCTSNLLGCLNFKYLKREHK